MKKYLQLVTTTGYHKCCAIGVSQLRTAFLPFLFEYRKRLAE